MMRFNFDAKALMARGYTWVVATNYDGILKGYVRGDLVSRHQTYENAARAIKRHGKYAGVGLFELREIAERQ